MKQILFLIVVLALIGCGKKKTSEPQTNLPAAPKAQVKNPEPTPSIPVNLDDPIVEKAVRDELNKPSGELTKADLRSVEWVKLGRKITNEGLKELVKLTNLNRLSLINSNITDADLKEVAKLKNLSHLFFDNCIKITDAGLKEVAKMKNLTVLALNVHEFSEPIKITDEGLKEVAKLENLTDLLLRNTLITDIGLKEIAKLKKPPIKN